VNLSNAQIDLLLKLNQPYKDYEKAHPKDAYKMLTVEALMRSGLIEEYSYTTFLHGALRLTDQGKKIVEEA
jgi:hypothetical protein